VPAPITDDRRAWAEWPFAFEAWLCLRSLLDSYEGGVVSAKVVRFALVLGAVLAIGAVLASPATATNGSDELTDRDQIVMNGRLVVAEGDTVDSAVIFHGSATINGTVTKSVVVFDGATEISGHVQQDVFVFNGPVTVRSGAQIDGDLVTSESPTVESGSTVSGQQQRISTRFDAGAVGVASRFAWWLGYSVSTLILGLLILLFAPGLDGAIARAVRERIGADIGFGALVFFLLPIVAVVFLVIVVAIPLGLFLLLALALLYTVGYVAGAHAIGRVVLKTTPSRFLAFLLGWGILRVLALIPVVGGLVWVLAAIFGLGVLWVASRQASGPAMPPDRALPPTPAAPA